MDIYKGITGKTRLLGVIGNPIEHSISPQLHNTISMYLNEDLAYVPFRVEKNNLESAVRGLKSLNFVGFNVTIPYKSDIIKYIDVNTREALLIGAVNTVKNINGKLYGYNTDAEGFYKSFTREAGTDFKDKKVALIGAGGAARAIAVKIALQGASKIYILNRTISKAANIAEVVNNNIKCVAEYYQFDKYSENILKQCDVIINTTSLGMYPDVDISPVEDTFQFSSHQIVYDVIYNPSRTKFLFAAENRGCKTINGFGMLIYQGIYAYEIWTGLKLPDDLVNNLFNSFRNYCAK